MESTKIYLAQGNTQFKLKNLSNRAYRIALESLSKVKSQKNARIINLSPNPEPAPMKAIVLLVSIPKFIRFTEDVKAPSKSTGHMLRTPDYKIPLLLTTRGHLASISKAVQAKPEEKTSSMKVV